MENKKLLAVVLAFVLSLTIAADYFIVKKIMSNTFNISSIINIDNITITDDIKKVSTTILAKDNPKIREANTVTSRSGMHKTQAADTNTSEVEANKNIEQVTEEPVQSKPTFEGVELEYNEVYHVSSSRLTKSKGVVYYNGHKETYYSQKVLSGKGLKSLNNNGRHVANDGTVRDGDGYIAVACNYLPKGSRIMTSLGPGKVYDTGGMTGKWIDIYVNW